MKAFPGNPAVYCTKCEDVLGVPKRVDPEKYALVPTKFGAVVRMCKGCEQLWLGYMQELPDAGHKIILKMIDKML